jgi:hypothetical protein
MAGYDLQFVERPFEKLGSLQRGIEVRHTVEPIAPDPVLLIVFVWKTVKVGIRRERVMKGRVEYRNMVRARKASPCLVDAHEVHGVV